MDKYPDGSPRQYWTQLAVEENGREVLRKRIHVNEPLTYQGIRFFQSSYGSTGIPERLQIEASWPGTTRPPLTFTLRPGEQIPLGDTGYRVELGDFVPDYVMQGNQLSTRSNEPNNPAVRVQLSDAGGKTSSAWFFPKAPQMNFADDSGVAFKLQNVKMGYTTGLQVAKQPGSWLIWGGCLLLSFGLFLALYVVHIRIWGVVGRDAKGRKVLVLGGQPSKYRESFEERFRHLADALDEALKKESTPVPELERLSA